MHFMRLSALRGSASPASGGLTLSTPIGGDATNVYGVSTTLNFTRPSLEVQILDNQEFMRGITTPVQPATLLYYLDQGWPQQTVLHMFVRSIEFFEKKEKGTEPQLVQRLTNYPANRIRFAPFQEYMNDLVGYELTIDAQPVRTPYGPPYASAALATETKGLAAARTADLELLGTDASGEITKAPQPSFYRFFKSRKESFLKLSNNPDLSDRRCAGPKKTQEIRFLLRSGDASNATAIQVSDTKEGESTVVFVLRSPEAMLFYLGELARAQLDGFYDQTGVPQIPGPMDAITISYGLSRDPQGSIGKQVKLFALSKGTLPEAVGISVEVEGQTYNVPAGSLTDRSMHVISLGRRDTRASLHGE